MLSIEDDGAAAAINDSSDIVFAYPVYYSCLPKPVKDFIVCNRSLWSGKRIFIIATMGLFSGDGTGVSARLFAKYGAEITGGLHLRMPDCIGDVKALKKSAEENKALVAAALKKLEDAAASYLSGKPPREGLGFAYHLAGLFGQRLYFGGIVKNYTSNPKIDISKCIGCGRCEALCPMQSIHVKNGKASAGNRCAMCYRCFSSCPEKAITIIGKTVYVQHKIENYL